MEHCHCCGCWKGTSFVCSWRFGWFHLHSRPPPEEEIDFDILFFSKGRTERSSESQQEWFWVLPLPIRWAKKDTQASVLCERAIKYSKTKSKKVKCRQKLCPQSAREWERASKNIQININYIRSIYPGPTLIPLELGFHSPPKEEMWDPSGRVPQPLKDGRLPQCTVQCRIGYTRNLAKACWISISESIRRSQNGGKQSGWKILRAGQRRAHYHRTVLLQQHGQLNPSESAE